MSLSREPFSLRMAIWLRGLERWCLVLSGVAAGHRFDPQPDLEIWIWMWDVDVMCTYCFVIFRLTDDIPHVFGKFHYRARNQDFEGSQNITFRRQFQRFFSQRGRTIPTIPGYMFVMQEQWVCIYNYGAGLGWASMDTKHMNRIVCVLVL
jgi:hypothetical protein